jgi:enoyl-CoA hydratase/carnithine racemase
MDTLTLEYHDDVTILRLNRGITNPINLKMVNDLAETLRSLKLNPKTRCLVLTSASDKFFSIGFDLPYLLDLPRVDFESFYQVFNQLCLDLFVFPKPTIAAINGHAVAGGYILALCCDYRLIAEGRRMTGLNEVLLGVPVPYLADCALRSLVGGTQAREILELGQFYPPDQAFHKGMVDQLLPPDELLRSALEQAKTLGALPEAAFTAIKTSRFEPVIAQVTASQEEKDRQFIDCWYSETARAKLKEAAKRF